MARIYRHGSLFNGLGGFQLAAKWMGWENVFHCEKDEFCNRVVAHHFPKSIPHGKIQETDFTPYQGLIDILSGGFPCQPFSSAGQRKGTADDRYLWPEYLRAAKQVQAPWLVPENVYGILNWSNGLVFEQIQIDLEAAGYEILPLILPACGQNAPHKRYRIWFVAHSAGFRCQWYTSKGEGIQRPESACGETGSSDNAIIANTEGLAERKPSDQTDTFSESGQTRLVTGGHSSLIADPWSGRQPEQGVGDRSCDSTAQSHWQASWSYNDGRWPTQSPVCGGDDGLPTRLDNITLSDWRKRSIEAFGNAIVPQIAYQIFRAIEATDNLLKK